MVLVEISSHGIYGDAFALDRETTIGRSATGDVRLADHTASKLWADRRGAGRAGDPRAAAGRRRVSGV